VSLSTMGKAKRMIANFNRENIMPASRRNRCAHNLMRPAALQRIVSGSGL
jgi:hypothetical protein